MEITVNFLDNLRLEAKFDDFTVMQTAMMGHKKLYDILEEKNAIEAKK